MKFDDQLVAAYQAGAILSRAGAFGDGTEDLEALKDAFEQGYLQAKESKS